MIPWEIFIKKYNESSPETRTLVDSDKIPSLSRVTLGTGEATTKEVRHLTTAITDYILSLITKEELKASIGISEENLLTLLNQIEQLQKSLLSDPSTTQQPTSVSEARPLTREELMQKLSPRRTMVADVASVQHPPVSQPAGTPVQGYEAYQNSKGPGAGR